MAQDPQHCGQRSEALRYKQLVDVKTKIHACTFSGCEPLSCETGLLRQIDTAPYGFKTPTLCSLSSAGFLCPSQAVLDSYKPDCWSLKHNNRGRFNILQNISTKA